MKKDEITNELDLMCGISDDELTFRFQEAVRIEKEKCKIKKVPIACYDVEKKQVYLEMPDGTIKYV